MYLSVNNQMFDSILNRRLRIPLHGFADNHRPLAVPIQITILYDDVFLQLSDVELRVFAGIAVLGLAADVLQAPDLVLHELHLAVHVHRDDLVVVGGQPRLVHHDGVVQMALRLHVGVEERFAHEAHAAVQAFVRLFVAVDESGRDTNV